MFLSFCLVYPFVYVVFLLEWHCKLHLQRTEVPLGILLMLMLLSDTNIFMYLAQKILSAPATCFLFYLLSLFGWSLCFWE